MAGGPTAAAAEPGGGASAESGRPIRADARRNRERLLKAAFEVFAEVGVDAQMTDIADVAGLGIGTLYRNFASKEQLVNALVLDRLTSAARAARKIVDAPDAWDALVRLIRSITDVQLENRVLSQFMGGRIAGSPELQEQRDIVYGILETVVERAKHDGQLRDDVNVADIRMIMMALAHVASSDSPLAQLLVMRYLGVVIDGLRAPAGSELPGPPLSIADSEDAFRVPSSGERVLRRGRRSWPR
jgi:AcrR family transcriptional regulator